MQETKKDWICTGEHYEDRVTSGQARGIGRFLKSIVIEPEGNEEFLDRITWIFVQQAMAMQEEEQARNRRETAASGHNS